MATYGTFTDGSMLKASELNDFFTTTTVTPVVRQTANLGNSAANTWGRYFRVNDLVIYMGKIAPQVNGTNLQRLELDLPVTAKTDNTRVIGNAYIFSTFHDFVVPVLYSTTRVAFIQRFGTITQYYDTALLTTHLLTFQLFYEAA